MNEAETRAELIDPALKAAGWGVVDGSRVRREVITLGRLQGAGRRAKQDIADYVLVYHNQKLAVIEAKRESCRDTEGVGRPRSTPRSCRPASPSRPTATASTASTCTTGEEGDVERYPTPDELWDATFGEARPERSGATASPRSPSRTRAASGSRATTSTTPSRGAGGDRRGQDRILLTLATGTGKTAIAFQIAWKLFQSRWNLTDWRARSEPAAPAHPVPRRPQHPGRSGLQRLLAPFPRMRWCGSTRTIIRKKGRVPKNGSVFFTIFQTFMTGRTTRATRRRASATTRPTSSTSS